MAAEVLIKFLGDSAQLGRVVNGIRQDTQQMDTGWQRAGKTLGNLKLPAIAAAGALFTMAHRAGQTADALLDMQEQTGVSTDKLQEMRYVADQAGVSQDFYAEAVNEVVKAQDRIARGTGPAAEALDTLGISAQNADGSLRGAQEITDDVMNALLGVEDASMRAALAEDIFKRKAQDMLPVLGMGADGIEDMRDRAHELGIVQSGEALDAANEYRQGMEELQAKVMAFSQDLMETLIPALLAVMNSIDDMATFLGGTVSDQIDPASRAIAEMSELMAEGATEAEAWADVMGGRFGPSADNAREALRGAIEATQAQAREMQFLASDSIHAADGLQQVATATRTAAEEQRKATDPAFALRRANEDMVEASAAVDRLKREGKNNTPEFVNALAAEAEAQADLNYATEQYEEAGTKAEEGLANLLDQAGRTRAEIDLLNSSMERMHELGGIPLSIDVQTNMDDIWRQLRIYEGGGNTPI